MQDNSIKCSYCECVPTQFTILICDHVICSDCIWGEKNQADRIETVKCVCGIQTCFNRGNNFRQNSLSAKTRQSAKLTSYASHLASPKASNSRYKRGSYEHCNETTFLDQQKQRRTMNFLQQCSIGGESSVPSQSLSKQLTNQIKYLQIQFTKSIEEVTKNYKMLLGNLKGSFQHFVTNIKYFCLEQIGQTDYDFVTLSRIIGGKFEKGVGRCVDRLNESLLALLGVTLADKQPRATAMNSRDKQNRNGAVSPNCKYYHEKEKLLNYIQQLKEDRKLNKKTCSRKAIKDRFRVL